MTADEHGPEDAAGEAAETGTDATEPAHEASEVDDGSIDALGVLGSEPRLEILLALGDRERAVRTNRYELTFSELYDAVDVASSSQFSYHLSQLVGPFVAETDDGYHLKYAGDKVVRAIRSGLYESTAAFEPVGIPGACVVCGATDLEALLRDERFVVRCRACEATLLSDSFPRSQADDRTPEAVVESFGYRIWSAYLLVRGGVCPECYGRVDYWVDCHDDGAQYTFAAMCAGCDCTIHLPIEVPALFHPTAIEYLWRHGIDLFDSPLWELFELVVSDEWTTTVASTDPLDATFRIAMDGEAVELAMDERFEVSPVDESLEADLADDDLADDVPVDDGVSESA
ncbi:DUF7351 domain-containing protein [Halosimplex amylolyticum]|uniref:DUF7351 domain-containing protein n=1 Tax=Halosimplex amylolyticum TaxID=3396616 RepID=UPI003F5470DF